MPSILIATTADAAHCEFAMEMIASVRSFPELAFARLGVLDVGLTEAQRQTLQSQNVIVAAAQWDLPGNAPADLPRGRLAMLSRPFLPKYFPDFDFIVYLDSDTWVQEAAGVIDLIEQACSADVALAPEMHPAYASLFCPGHMLRRHHNATFAALYGTAVALPGEYVVLNTGVFAAGRNSRLWQAWAESLGEAVENRSRSPGPGAGSALAENSGVVHLIEQNALNHAFYANKITVSPLSALYNWICSMALPIFDPKRGKLVEPTPPRAPIRILHLTAGGKRVMQVRDTAGKSLDRGLRWRDWRAGEKRT